MSNVFFVEDGLEAIVAQTKQSVFEADDEERTVVCGERVDEPVAPEIGAVAHVVSDEALTVELRQAAVGADPQVAGGVFGDGRNRVLRQAVAVRPGEPSPSFRAFAAPTRVGDETAEQEDQGSKDAKVNGAHRLSLA